jgi:hypothetical protein
MAVDQTIVIVVMIILANLKLMALTLAAIKPALSRSVATG